MSDFRTFGRSNPVEVENREVGRHARRDYPAARNAEETRGLRSDPLDRMFERKRLPPADEIADEISGIASVAQHIDVGAAVRNSDHRARITELARDPLFVDV